MNKDVAMEKLSVRKSSSTPAINLVLRVEGFETRDGVEYVKGTSLESGQKVEACLAPMEDASKRRSLMGLSKGFKFGKETYQLKPGGILCIDMARKQADGTYMGRWPTVLAYTENDIGHVRHGLFTFCAFETQKGGRVSYAIQHATNPRNFICADQPEGLRAGVKNFSQTTHTPTFTIRAVKPGTQEVVCWHAVLNNFNKRTQAPCTPDEMAENVVNWANMMRKEHPDVHFDVVPGIRYNFSREVVKNDASFNLLKKMSGFFRAREGEFEGEYLAKKAAIKVGGEHGEYCNELRVIDPYEPGIMPACISPVLPAHDQRPEPADPVAHEPANPDHGQEAGDEIDIEAALGGLPPEEDDGPGLG